MILSGNILVEKEHCMKYIIEEYSEAIVGVIAGTLMIGIILFVFADGGLLEQLLLETANASI